MKEPTRNNHDLQSSVREEVFHGIVLRKYNRQNHKSFSVLRNASAGEFCYRAYVADVPEARITVEGGQVVRGEGGHMATEGSDVTFLCSVTAHPPAYNVTWLHNVSFPLCPLTL